MFETLNIVIGAMIIVLNAFALSTKKSASILITAIVSLILLGLLLAFK